MHYEKKVRNRLNRCAIGSYRAFVRQYVKTQMREDRIP